MGSLILLPKQIGSLNIRTYGEGLCPSDVFEETGGSFVLLFLQVSFAHQKTRVMGSMLNVKETVSSG